MGADLCGYMCVGPRKIHKSDIKTAERHVQRLAQLAKDAIAETFTGPTVVDDAKNLPKELRTLLDQIENIGLGYYENPAEALETFLEWAPSIVAQTVDTWDNEGWRDQTSRNIPAEIKGRRWTLQPSSPLKIIFAGERTSGDGPDAESAWGTFQRADACGILEILGID